MSSLELHTPLLRHNMLEKRVNEFVSECLAEYSSARPRPKFVHDPIWGTIEVKGYEAAILDTPLLQRLRHIHQTGFVFQTYPSARHSRFEHTMGVMHAAGRIADIAANLCHPIRICRLVEGAGEIACLLVARSDAIFITSKKGPVTSVGTMRPLETAMAIDGR